MRTARPRRTPDGIHCKLKARLVGLDPVFVTECVGTAHQTIHGAVLKLESALSSAIGKHDLKHKVRRAGHQHYVGGT
jgi:hypothetical protein